jgi:hypothetical protein
MSKKTLGIIVLAILIVISVFTIIRMGSITGEVTDNVASYRFKSPQNDYRKLEPRDCILKNTAPVVFGDYKFTITQYDDSYYEPICKTPTGYDCQELGEDEYGCMTYSCRYNTRPRVCSIPSNCWACIGVYCQSEGIGGKHRCDEDDWERYNCRYLDVNARRTEGGRELEYIKDQAGVKWTLEYQDNIIANQTEYLRNGLYFKQGNYTNDDDVYIKDGKAYSTRIDGYEYNIARYSRGTRYSNICEYDYPFLGFNFNPNYNSTNLKVTIDLNESYTFGQEANVEMEICNDFDFDMYGVFDMEYKIDSFVGTLTKTVTKELDINKGCSIHKIDFATNDSIRNFKINNNIKIYRDDISGIVVQKDYVIGQEDINFDKVVLSLGQKVQMMNVNFEEVEVNILPRVTEDDLVEFQQKIDNKELDIEDLRQLLSDSELTMEELEEKLEKLGEETDIAKLNNAELIDLVLKEQRESEELKGYIWQGAIVIVILIAGFLTIVFYKK